MKYFAILFVFLASCASVEPANPVYVGETLPTVSYETGSGSISTIDSGFTEDGFRFLRGVVVALETKCSGDSFEIVEMLGILNAPPTAEAQKVARPSMRIFRPTMWEGDSETVLAVRVVVFETTGLAFEIGRTLAANRGDSPRIATIQGIPAEMVKVVTVANTDRGVFISIRRLSSSSAIAALVSSLAEAEAFLENANIGAEDEFGRPIAPARPYIQ